MVDYWSVSWDTCVLDLIPFTCAGFSCCEPCLSVYIVVPMHELRGCIYNCSIHLTALQDTGFGTYFVVNSFLMFLMRKIYSHFQQA